MTCFADTFYYLALANPADAAHERAVAITATLRERVVTTEFVLMEVGDALSLPGSRETFVALLGIQRTSPHVEVVPASTALFDRGVAFFQQRSDKAWSLTDCISFVIMEDRHIRQALTADRHFEQAGFEILMK